MGVIKLFEIAGGNVNELEGGPVAVEKTLQMLMEQHLETFLGIRFLESEYSTGPVHRGRIDTLGLDENNCPVIIEYKRSQHGSLLTQGLFYLDWLMDHKAEFEQLAAKKLQVDHENIEWSSPRLVCIASDFTRYDDHAVVQIGRNIDLVRYRQYPSGFLVLELAKSMSSEQSEAPARAGAPRDAKTISDILSGLPEHLGMLFSTVSTYLESLGDDVTVKTLKFYVGFRRLGNFACLDVRPQSDKILAYVKVNPDSVELEDGFTRDVRPIGHYGTGDLEITIRTLDDFERAKPLFERAYEME